MLIQPVMDYKNNENKYEDSQRELKITEEAPSHFQLITA